MRRGVQTGSTPLHLAALRLPLRTPKNDANHEHGSPCPQLSYLALLATQIRADTDNFTFRPTGCSRIIEPFLPISLVSQMRGEDGPKNWAAAANLAIGRERWRRRQVRGAPKEQVVLGFITQYAV